MVRVRGGLHRVGHVADTLGCTIALADIRIAQGRLGDALRTYEQALAAHRAGGGAAGNPGHARRDERGAPSARRPARGCGALQRGQELGEYAGLAQYPYRRRVATARVRQAEGDLDGARGLLDEARTRLRQRLLPRGAPHPRAAGAGADRAGRAAQALAWARSAVYRDDALSYLREFEHITLARVLLAQHAAEGGDASREVVPARSTALATRTSCSPGCSRPRRQGAGRRASSRSSCCRPSRGRPATTCLLRSRRCSAR